MVSINFNNKALWPNLKTNIPLGDQNKKEELTLRSDTSLGDTLILTPKKQAKVIDNGSATIKGEEWKWARQVSGEYVVWRTKKNGKQVILTLTQEALKKYLDQYKVDYTESEPGK